MLVEDDRHGANGNMMPERDSMNHVHLLITMTNVADNHQHVIVGTTGPAKESNRSHVHPVRIRTSFDPKKDSGHWHITNKLTGPAIELPDNTHTHFFCGETTYDEGHKHGFSTVTDTTDGSDYSEEDTCNFHNYKNRE